VHLKHGYCMLIHFIHGYYCIHRPWQPLTYLCFLYHCISLIYFSFTKISMFLYARIYWLAEFGGVSCLQTLTPTWEDFVGQFGRTILRVKSDKTLCPTWEFDRWYTWRDLYVETVVPAEKRFLKVIANKYIVIVKQGTQIFLFH
jgi:hypothetical protein